MMNLLFHPLHLLALRHVQGKKWLIKSANAGYDTARDIFVDLDDLKLLFVRRYNGETVRINGDYNAVDVAIEVFAVASDIARWGLNFGFAIFHNVGVGGQIEVSRNALCA